MKSFLIITFIISLLTLKANDSVRIYPAPEGAVRSDDFTVLVNDRMVDLFGSENRYGSRTSFGYFDFEGSVEVDVIFHHAAPHSASIRIIPESYGITAENVSNGHIRFTLDKPANLSFIHCGDYTGRTLHLFASPFEDEIPDKNDQDVIWYGPGYHEISEGQNRTITLKSNQTLYLEGGAYVVGVVRADSAVNVKIAGRGILCQLPEYGVPKSIAFYDCSGIDISGIIVNRQRIEWSGLMSRCSDVRIHDYKVVSVAIWSTDGMNLANTSDAVIDNCFFRAGDDNIAIKGLGTGRSRWKPDENPSESLPNRNIKVSNCIFWSDNNNAVVLGQETITDIYENITFTNCDVLFVRDEEPVKAAIALICLHTTDYRNIRFEDFRVGPSGQLIAVFFTESIFRLRGNHSLWPGRMEDIVFRNISTNGSGSKMVRIEGWDNSRPVKKLLLENITINGRKLDKDSPYLITNEFVKELQISD